ncbi:ribonuclease H-like domain-containing protein, partial [Tanacetum coccineum]
MIILCIQKSCWNFDALHVYVYDILVTGNDVKEIDEVKTFLNSKFKIKDLDELKYFLGIEVLKTEKGVKKQASLSKSSAEAEYRSMATTTCEVMWIVNILKDLKVTNLLPAELYCDNSAAIQITANLVMHEKTKHFDLDVHIIKEKVAS